MAKRISLQNIKTNGLYTVEELAEALSVTQQTIRKWGDQGLLILKEHRPHLVPGFAVKDFFAKRSQRTKHPLEIDEVYCPRCRVARKPFGMMADYIPINSSRGRLLTLCSVCECQCSRLVGTKSLPDISLKLGIAIRS